MNASKALIRMLNVVSIDYSAVAQHFVTKAPGPVIRNFFQLFEAVANVVEHRLDTDTWDDVEEYECAIIVKRMNDGLNGYEE